ncbi:hypothetical protein [Alkalicoccobacillus gibsonii]|nr:hypothetical protein [Alkalicoccobacillus gibsonii]MBM0065414.1 hypothetical protein [Alkalicoccobacillus gibsonii]
MKQELGGVTKKNGEWSKLEGGTIKKRASIARRTDREPSWSNRYQEVEQS